MPGSLDPYTPEELWGVFSAEFGSTNKHLLILLSLAVGVYAQRAMELGVGPSTRALRAAMKITGGRLWSCDIDRPRFAENLPRQDEHWSLALCPSGEFFRSLEPPFDFAFHDAAHDYWQVKEDLRRMLPLMRRYALICIHDTQNSLYGQTLVRAIEDAVKDSSVAYVHLPFSMGLTIIRVEGSPHPPISTPWRWDGDEARTLFVPSPMLPASPTETPRTYYRGDRLKHLVRKAFPRLTWRYYSRSRD